MQEISYFIPDWDDRVDPAFDFLHDRFSSQHKATYERDRYAHELLIDRAYDGILVSMATVKESISKYRAIIDVGSIHAYLRLPLEPRYQVIGDCGAFSYWQQQTPPYTTQDALDFYQSCGTDIGVSVDHLIFTQDPEERERRWQVTHTNAREFLQMYRRGNYSFVPFGVAQGWSPESYQRAARELIAMGYEAIAIGGLVRSTTEDILAILTAVHDVVPLGLPIHLFGVNRLEAIDDFLSKGVTSFDSASRLRRAWMDDRDNYYLGSNSYSAIRIPEATRLAKLHPEHHTTCLRLEREALHAVRAYAHNELPLHDAIEVIMEYDGLARAIKSLQKQSGETTMTTKSEATDARILLRRRGDFTRTLAERVWEHCSCTICQQIGVEVVIFRGNNRNRRRGFHNTWQLYRSLQHSLTNASPHLA